MKKKNYFLPISVLISIVLIVGSVIYDAGQEVVIDNNQQVAEHKALEDRVVSKSGTLLPIKWNDLGIKMVEAGVIDAPRFEALYANSGGLNEERKNVLYGSDNDSLLITPDNSRTMLNILWAFGISNKNKILTQGPMVDERYGGNPGNFASVGGWSLAVGDPMNHYGKHSFVSLTDAQQERVEHVSKGIFRPCCGNSTHFPDCNHGMAMLGLLQLLASNGASEDEMYDIALIVNSYWFPDTYITIASYFEQNGVFWNSVNPKIALGSEFSSSNGYQRVIREMESFQPQRGGDCSV